MIHILLENITTKEKELEALKKEVKALLKKQNNTKCFRQNSIRYLYPMEFNRLSKSDRLGYVYGTTYSFGTLCLRLDVKISKKILVNNRSAYDLDTYIDLANKMYENKMWTKRKSKKVLDSLQIIKPTQEI